MKKKIIQTPTFKRSQKAIIISDPKLKNLIRDSISFFDESRQNPILNDHALESPMLGLRAFTVAPDIRIIYLETNDRFVFLNIGTHKQVYRR